MAHHPYPESLFEPKTWLDQKVQFDFNTPLITFKNIEVINAWIKLPEALYQGKQKRTLWLSENGTNSPTYSEQDLREQAAGFAYTWKKLRTLDGIDGFQWHNWFDSRGEGGQHDTSRPERQEFLLYGDIFLEETPYIKFFDYSKVIIEQNFFKHRV